MFCCDINCFCKCLIVILIKICPCVFSKLNINSRHQICRHCLVHNLLEYISITHNIYIQTNNIENLSDIVHFISIWWDHIFRAVKKTFSHTINRVVVDSYKHWNKCTKNICTNHGGEIKEIDIHFLVHTHK